MLSLLGDVPHRSYLGLLDAGRQGARAELDKPQKHIGGYGSNYDGAGDRQAHHKALKSYTEYL